MSNEWLNKYRDTTDSEETIDYLLNPQDKEDFETYYSKNQSTRNNDDQEEEETSYFVADNRSFDNQPTLLIDKNDMVKKIAPAEGLAPRSILSDKDAEELTFLKIYN